jgi:riboflavin synthase
VFTGLVEACVPVRSCERRAEGARLVLPLPGPDWRPRHGESIAVSGCCLTVVGGGNSALEFDLSAETLARTCFGEFEPGRVVNLERALKLDDRLGGHLVSGHVDGVGRITAIEDSHDGGVRMGFEVPAGFERYLIEKGSVTIDGISLTVVEPRGQRFDVALISETLAKTNLGSARVGQRVNLEADLVGKWIERLVSPHARA